jgi:hypothetical protein
MIILDLHRQGLSITAIVRRTGRDPKTVRKYICAWVGAAGLQSPASLAFDGMRERSALILLPSITCWGSGSPDYFNSDDP